MKNFFQFLLLPILFSSTKSFAMPGLDKSLKAIHPEMHVSCTVCHNRENGEVPHYGNVNKLGRAYYIEIMESSKFKGAPNNKKPRFTISQNDFIVFGDSRSNLNINKKAVDRICSFKPRGVLHTGDMVENGEELSQWKNILPLYSCLLSRKNLYPSCGNHEGIKCTDNPIRKALGNSRHYYTVATKGFTFIALDSQNITGEELQWLDKLPVGPNYIPFFHHPAYTTINGHQAEPTVVKEFVPRFKRLKVKLVFAGHNHGYERSLAEGVQWVVSGGGGAPLYPCGTPQPYTQSCVSAHHIVRCEIQKNKVLCIAELLDGSLIDSFTVDYP